MDDPVHNFTNKVTLEVMQQRTNATLHKTTQHAFSKKPGNIESTYAWQGKSILS